MKQHGNFMKTLNPGMAGLEVPVIAAGCMRINALSKEDADTLDAFKE
jgi:hypothetical protein